MVVPIAELPSADGLMVSVSPPSSKRACALSMLQRFVKVAPGAVSSRMAGPPPP
jgi:hypothetical protein